MNQSMKNVLKLFVCLFLTITILPWNAGNEAKAALKDGAYIVSRTSYYLNPETGETSDGGSNIALGESMIESVLDDEVLVEKVNGKTYITIGLGLMSSVSNVTIDVQKSQGGSYKNVAITKTGSCTRDGDTCNHYRFEVVSTDYYISPSIYVTPMGREVTFYLKLNMSSAVAGTGSYRAEMVEKDETTGASDAIEEEKETTNTESNNSSSDSDHTSNETTSNKTEESSNNGNGMNSESNNTSSTENGSTTNNNSTSNQAETSESATNTTMNSSQSSEDVYNTQEEEASEDITEELAEEESTEEAQEELDINSRFEEEEGITVYQGKEETAEEVDEVVESTTSTQTLSWVDVIAFEVLVLSAIGIGDFIGRKRTEKAYEKK